MPEQIFFAKNWSLLFQESKTKSVLFADCFCEKSIRVAVFVL